ncbi:MAG TPA: metallophosphoesterase, partial [Woeseiaceae bacterium]
MTYLRTHNPLRALVALALLLLIAGNGAGNALANEWRWSDVPRVVAISDVHGAYDAMVRTLQNANVLGEDLLWSGGATHLVITGDLLDRGPESRQAMDLVMRLEEEAVAAGGRVHLLLGNHEVMNLVGDLRYVAAAEYAAFATEDDEGAAAADDNDSDKALPPGFLAHRRAFAADGQYGAWLLGKPLIVVVNDTAFVHGGLSPRVSELGLEGINGDMKARLVEYVTQMGVLIDAGLIEHTDDYYERPEKLAALPADKSRPAELQAAIDTVIRLSDDAIHDSDSPLWYRGNVACSPLIAIDLLSAALKRIEATRVVIGHTPTPARGVLQRLDGRVIEIDTGMLNNYYGGKGHALIIEGDTLAVVNETDDTASAPAPHPRRIDLLAADVPATDLEKWLATGEIVSSAQAADRTVVQLRHDG